jgi:hypothetical protein
MGIFIYKGKFPPPEKITQFSIPAKPFVFIPLLSGYTSCSRGLGQFQFTGIKWFDRAICAKSKNVTAIQFAQKYNTQKTYPAVSCCCWNWISPC